MPLTFQDIKFHLSSAVGSTGGAIGSEIADQFTEVAGITSANNLIFPALTLSQRQSGYTDYRCIYIRNGSDVTANFATIYFLPDGPGGNYDNVLSIGVGTSAVNGTEQTIANPTTAPSGITFSRPLFASQLSLGALPSGQHRAVWIRRVIPAGYAGLASPNDQTRAYRFSVIMSEE